MKTNTFDKQLDEILHDVYLAGWNDNLAGGTLNYKPQEMPTKAEAKKRLIDLVLNDVIGDDEPITTKIGKGSVSNGIVVFRNDLREKQRAVVKGGNHED